MLGRICSQRWHPCPVACQQACQQTRKPTAIMGRSSFSPASTRAQHLRPAAGRRAAAAERRTCWGGGSGSERRLNWVATPTLIRRIVTTPVGCTPRQHVASMARVSALPTLFLAARGFRANRWRRCGERPGGWRGTRVPRESWPQAPNPFPTPLQLPRAHNPGNPLTARSARLHAMCKPIEHLHLVV